MLGAQVAAREAPVRLGADAIVAVANDWKAIDSLQLQVHAWRAIEIGAPLVRAAGSGFSAAIDPWGRVRGVASLFDASDGAMIAHVPMAHVPTIYARAGDWLGWLCVSGTLFTIIFRVVCTSGS
jgi:apolipoprotein N-acyltransferase